MHQLIHSPLPIGNLILPHRLIQGPLAGYSCAPFRILFNQFKAPAYCVSEMCSAVDILHKHKANSRYVYRHPQERLLAYQIAGNDPQILAAAALRLQNLGADIIDLNCGCPKTKIRKKGSGSALLEKPEALVQIIECVRQAISIPLTVKIRIQGNDTDIVLAQQIAAAGADALIVHGRRWVDDYAIACDFQQIALIKNNVPIPVIANGDIRDSQSLSKALAISQCDGFMISRAGSGKPWLYQELLEQKPQAVDFRTKVDLFMQHLSALAVLENEHKAVLQSKSLVRYYFRNALALPEFYQLGSLEDINCYLTLLPPSTRKTCPVI